MRTSKISILFTLTIVALFAASGCSEVKNREKTTGNNSFKGSSVSIKVEARSTTTGEQTVPTLDKDIEQAATKILSQVLISGVGKEDLFSEQALATIGDSFPNYKKAKSNLTSITFDYLDSQNDLEKVLVTSLTQKIETAQGQNITNKGKIYLDSSGKIIGFDVTATQPNKSVTS